MAFAGAQSLTRQMNGHERGRTGCVDRNTGPLQSQYVRQPTRRDAVGNARQVIHIQQRWIAGFNHALGIIIAADAKINPGASFLEIRRRLAGMFESFPTHFEQQTLVWIHRERFAGRDTKELRLEPVHLIQESAKPRGNLARGVGIRIVVGFYVPTIPRNFSHATATLAQQLPEVLGTIRAARNATAQTDNRDGFALLAFDRVEFRLQFFNRKQRALQRREFGHALNTLGYVHGRGITFAPVVSIAEPRLHRRTRPQPPERVRRRHPLRGLWQEAPVLPPRHGGSGVAEGIGQSLRWSDDRRPGCPAAYAPNQARIREGFEVEPP